MWCSAAIISIQSHPCYTQKGYPAASVDSIWEKGDTVYIKLFVGRKYEWAAVKPGEQIDKKALTGWFYRKFDFHKSINRTVAKVQQRCSTITKIMAIPLPLYLFRQYHDQRDDKPTGILSWNGIFFIDIDSIRLYGTAKINKDFLQRYPDQ